MPLGYKTQKTIDKEVARELLRQRVKERLFPLVDSQIDNAIGIRHFFLRGPGGKFERVTDPEQIERALNAPGAKEGTTFWIYTKDPSTAAFTDLMNRTIDKPADHMELLGNADKPLQMRWMTPEQS